MCLGMRRRRLGAERSRVCKLCAPHAGYVRCIGGPRSRRSQVSGPQTIRNTAIRRRIPIRASYKYGGAEVGRLVERRSALCVTRLCGVAAWQHGTPTRNCQLPSPLRTQALVCRGQMREAAAEDIQPKPPRRETISTPSRVFARACSPRRRDGAFQAPRTRACGTTAAAPCRAPSPRPASSCSRRACGC